MKTINDFINRFFGIVLLLAAIAGMFVDVGKIDTSLIIILALSVIIFSSCFRISPDRKLIASGLKQLIFFYILRFVLLPLSIYFILVLFSPFYASTLFLLLLLPSAVSSPAFTSIFGGDTGLSLKILVITSIMSVIIIPLMSRMVLAQNVDVDSRHMLLIMITTIVIPFVLHLPLRRSEQITRMVTSNLPIITSMLLAVINLVSTSRNRELILQNPLKILVYAAIATGLFFVLYLLGYVFMFRQERTGRIAYSVCSGANNIGLGVTLALLFFPSEIGVFFIVSQLAWNVVIIPVRYFYRMVR